MEIKLQWGDVLQLRVRPKPKCKQRSGKTEISGMDGGSVIDKLCWEMIWSFLVKLNMCITYDTTMTISVT